jgi:hypothetical protein
MESLETPQALIARRRELTGKLSDCLAALASLKRDEAKCRRMLAAIEETLRVVYNVAPCNDQLSAPTGGWQDGSASRSSPTRQRLSLREYRDVIVPLLKQLGSATVVEMIVALECAFDRVITDDMFQAAIHKLAQREPILRLRQGVYTYNPARDFGTSSGGCSS